MKLFKSSFTSVAVLLCSASFACQAAVTLTLLPASVTGPAGSVVGWGYSITNTTGDYAVTTNLAEDLFSNGTPLSLFDFPVIAPGATINVPFANTVTGACPVPDCGLFELTWDSTAPAGFTNTGTFTLSLEYFATNPLTDPNAVDLGPTSATATYTATVSGVPEPGTVSLFLCGVGGCIAALRRRRNP